MLLGIGALQRDLHRGPKTAQGQRSLDPSEPWHTDIEQSDLWVLLNAELDCLGAIDCLKYLSAGDRVAQLQGK